MRQHESEGRKRARRVIARTGHHLGRMGGHLAEHGHSDYEADKRLIDHQIRKAINEHDVQLHDGHPTRLKLASGGMADGAPSSGRADRSPRGDKGKHTHIAIVVNPGEGGQQQARPVPVPVPVHPPMAPPAAAAPPPGGMPPTMLPRPAGPPMMPPPGGMPGGMPMGMHKSGGRTGTRGRPHMTAGSGSGEGRLEKSAALDYCEGGRSHDR